MVAQPKGSGFNSRLGFQGEEGARGPTGQRHCLALAEQHSHASGPSLFCPYTAHRRQDDTRFVSFLRFVLSLSSLVCRIVPIAQLDRASDF